jgi:hypothetical protein
MLTLRDILNAQPALQRLAAEKLPVRVAYRLKKNLDQVERELRHYEAFRRELIQKYGRQTGPDAWEIPADDQEAVAVYSRELGELLDCEADMALRPMRVDDLGEIRMSAGDLMAMAWLFEDEPEPEQPEPAVEPAPEAAG